MYGTACLRALAAVTVALAGLGEAEARAEQSGSAAPPRQTAPTAASAQAPAKDVARASVPGRAAQPAGSQPASSQELTPAQQKYGLPVTPQVGGPVDTDLSKPLALQRAIRIGLLRQNSIAI